MKTFDEEVKETLYEFASDYGLLVDDTHFDNYITGNIKSLILQRIDSCPVVNMESKNWGTKIKWIDSADLHRAFGIVK